MLIVFFYLYFFNSLFFNVYIWKIIFNYNTYVWKCN